MVEDDIYKCDKKCEYTGMPIFTEYCDCYIHRKYFTNIVTPPRITRSRSHELLNIFPPVTEREIKVAYHKLCLTCHPDKGGDSRKFIEVNDAYEELLAIC
tara:strand:+ start:92 stop:391 length:300 start_codon:yes stop_codon:yes gene_type:complete